MLEIGQLVNELVLYSIPQSNKLLIPPPLALPLVDPLESSATSHSYSPTYSHSRSFYRYIPEYLKHSIELTKEYIDGIILLQHVNIPANANTNANTNTNANPKSHSNFNSHLNTEDLLFVRQLFGYIQIALKIMLLVVSKQQRNLVLDMQMQINNYAYYFNF